MCARGSWKTTATSEASQRRSSAPFNPNTSVPSKRTLPLATAPRGSRCTIERKVMVLPEPDSPTSPTASPASTCSATSWITGRLPPSGPGSSTCSPSISNNDI